MSLLLGLDAGEVTDSFPIWQSHHPWRHLGTLIAIKGVLTFGCSTAFLFLVLQDVWNLLN